MNSSTHRLHSALGSQATGQAVGMTAGMLAIIWLSQGMDPVAYGRFLLIWAFVTTASTVLRLGLTRSAAREIPLAAGSGDSDEAGRLTRAATQLQLSSAVVGAPLVLVAAAVVVPSLAWLSWAALFVALTTALEAIRSTAETLLRAVARPVLAQVLGAPLRSVCFAGACLVAALSPTPWSLLAALTAFLAVNLLAAVATAAALIFTAPRGDATRAGRDQRSLLLVAAPAFLAIDVSAVLLTQGDVLVAGRILPPVDLTAYAVAARFAVVFTLPALVINTAIAPRVAYLAGQTGLAAADTFCRRLARVSLLFTVCLVVPFALFGRTLLATLFGPSGEAAHRPAVILGLATCVLSVAAFSGLMLIVRRRDRLVVGVMSTTAAAQMALCAPAGVWHGTTGIAIVSAAATVCQATILHLALRRSQQDGQKQPLPSPANEVA